MDVFLEMRGLEASREAFEAFLLANYEKFYKSERVRHAARQDKRLPRLKITGDLVSMQLYFKDRSGEERHFIFDGSISKEGTVRFSSIEPFSFGSFEDESLPRLEILKSLSAVCGGEGIFASVNGEPKRIKGGRVHDYKTLVGELCDALSEDKKKELSPLCNWLKIAFD